MISPKNFATCAFFIIALTQITHAQNSPQDYVDAHNIARAAVNVRPLVWDDNVAAYAQQYANHRKSDCALKNSGGPYGENLAQGSGDFLTGRYAVKLWVNEKVYYDYNSNTCTSGKQCGGYTQVVWRKSIRVGCARVKCNNGWYFVICNYAPPGNVIGQRPF